MTQPGQGAEGERRLTPGERNEQRRQERRAARRAATPAEGRPGQGAGSGQRRGRAGDGESPESQKPGAGQQRGRAEPARNPERPRSGGAVPSRTGKMRKSSAERAHRESAPTRRDGADRESAPTRKDGAHRESAPTRRDGADRESAPTRKDGAGADSAATRRAQPGSAPTKPLHRHREATPIGAKDAAYRAGFACFVGRPNAGKSTLTNAIIGQKIAITSNKPQTTRHVIRAVLHRDNAQLVLVDTPGLHRPRTLLGERLNDLVREVWSEVDVIGVCFPADEPVGRGDRFISAEMAELKATVIAVVTKVDLVDSGRLAKHLVAVSGLYDFAEIVPVSAVSGHQVQTLVDVMIKYLPESPQLYPDDVLTDEPEQVLIAELIREAALEGVRDELPHSIAVLVEEMMVEGGLTKIYADLYVERDSQKSIVIGSRGTRLKEVGIHARHEIEQLLGTRVYLDLHVRVAKEWQRDPRQLRKLGF